MAKRCPGRALQQIRRAAHASIPLTTINSASPSAMACAADMTACKPDPQALLMIAPPRQAGMAEAVEAFGCLPAAYRHDPPHDHCRFGRTMQRATAA
jgi:hypothetical protein